MPLSEFHQKILAEARAQRDTSRDLNRRNDGGPLGARPTRARRGPSAAQRAKAAREARAAVLAPVIADATLAHLARVICADWEAVNANVWNPARPYVRALEALDVVDPHGEWNGADDAVSTVLYFLNNAKAWRGPVARVVKAELRRRCGPPVRETQAERDLAEHRAQMAGRSWDGIPER